MLKIGPYLFKNPWILAPMAGVSEMPFRAMALRFGAGAAPTELVSAKGLLYGQARTARYLTHDPIEQPFWVQIFGGDAPSMVQGARRAAELGAKIIDINMGCPVRKVTKNGAGSALLCDPIRAALLVSSITRETGLPVTVKIRAGWDAHTLNYIEMGQRLADAGCQAVSMHARTRAQGYSGQAHWPWIAELVQNVNIPVIGNGDVLTPKDAHRMQAETGCAAVMIGRAVLGNPWFFKNLQTGDQAYLPTATERWHVIQEHLQAHLNFVGDTLQGIKRFRPHLMWYAHGLVGGTAFRRHVHTITDLSELLDMCGEFFGEAKIHAQSTAIDFDTRTALG